MHQVGIQLANLDQVLHLRNRNFGSTGHHRVEVAGGLAINEVAPFITLPGFNQGEVCFQCVFHHVEAAIEFAGFLIFGDHCAHARRREESRNASAAGPDAFRKCSLRHQVQFNLALQDHLFQQFILTNVGSNVLAKLAGCEQQAYAKAIHASVVAHGG